MGIRTRDYMVHCIVASALKSCIEKGKKKFFGNFISMFLSFFIRLKFECKYIKVQHKDLSPYLWLWTIVVLDPELYLYCLKM